MLRNEASQVKQMILIKRSFVPQDDKNISVTRRFRVIKDLCHAVLDEIKKRPFGLSLFPEILPDDAFKYCRYGIAYHGANGCQ